MRLTKTRVIGGVAAMMVAAGATMFMLSGGPTTQETVLGPTVHQVPAGASLQAAIDAAASGDTLQLANAVYECNCVENKGLTIVGPATIRAPVANTAGATIYYPPKTPPAALRNLTITSSTDATKQAFDIIRYGATGEAQDTFDEQPLGLTIDSVTISGQVGQEVQRGVTMNGRNFSITNSVIKEIHGRGYDTQALCAWNGSGPFKIIKNRLEAAGENIMFGGADPSIPNLIPSDIEIRNNYVFKPLTWKVGHPTYAGIHWTIKNLLEFKLARNVIVDGNVFENSWGDAQIGYAILFTVRNQDGRAPWATIENATFTNNIVKNSEQGIQLLGTDNLKPSGIADGLAINNNLFTGILNRFLTMSGGYKNVTLDHNTHEQGGNIMTLAGTATAGFKYTNNITVRMPAGFGIKGDAVEEGVPTLSKYVPDHRTARNVIAMAATLVRFYPTDNFYPVTRADIGLGADYRLSPTSAFKGKATDGTDPGVDMSKLEAAQAGATPSPSASPSASTSLPSPSATPTATSTPTPVVTPTIAPLPTPTATATPAPTATPTPQPSPSLPRCTANQIIGNPVKCLCTTGIRCTGNNARCL